MSADPGSETITNESSNTIGLFYFIQSNLFYHSTVIVEPLSLDQDAFKTRSSVKWMKTNNTKILPLQNKMSAFIFEIKITQGDRLQT